ncbi:hypothetical protein IDT60_20445 (plasmid) [Pseudarthrobacter sp. BIM B-2242]|nr:hypothetical protein IDT60_20445 [Pseudarthrobacter sp. BIM B-2242]
MAVSEAPVRRRGYHRPRTLPAPEQFTLAGHRFETDGKDLWVTPPDTERIDRFKVTRYLSSRSMKQGYPVELVRPEPMTAEFARSAAAFWLEWSTTADAAAHPPVFLDHYVRQLESGSA